MHSIRNFGGNIGFTPLCLYEPTREQGILDILDHHAHGKVRVMGALHSWSPAVVSDDAVVNLRHFNHVRIDAGPDGVAWVTAGGGCRIKHLLARLHRAGLTLPSIGLITEQTIAGAISTATHGSGRHSLSHYVDELRVAAYDPVTGKARIYTWNHGVELRAARCALGCIGIILSVRIRCVPRYDIAETVVACDRLDEVLAGESEHPLQQFYLLPHRWSYFVQRRTPRARGRPSVTAWLYRAWWFFGIDVTLHFVIRLLASTLGIPWLIRFFYRHVLPPLILKNVTITDRADRMLVMRHDLFRHLEIELFVPAAHLRPAATLVRAVLEVFDGAIAEPPSEIASALEQIGMLDELRRARGTFTHHYPIAVRRVLPDDGLIAMSSGDEGPYYAMSFITYVEPRGPFYRFASFLAGSMARLYSARPHWGKHFPLGGAEVERLYHELPAFRIACHQGDPNGVFCNAFAAKVIFARDGA